MPGSRSSLSTRRAIESPETRKPPSPGDPEPMRRPLLALLTACLLTIPARAEIVPPKDAEPGPFDHLEWRNVGPVNMSGRVTDVEGVAGLPRVVYVGAGAPRQWQTHQRRHAQEPQSRGQHPTQILEKAH